MPATESDALVVRGEDGAIYAAPRALLEQCWVPAAKDEAEVSGHLLSAFPPTPVRAPSFQVMGFVAFPPSAIMGTHAYPPNPV